MRTLHATPISIAELLPGKTLLIVPHFDDEILGCGGALALLPENSHVHIIFATAGDSLPIRTHQVTKADNIERIRKEESLQALSLLGIARENIHFLDIPEGTVRQHSTSIKQKIEEIIKDIRPDNMLTPFRHDQHSDHTGLHTISRKCIIPHNTIRLIEYFVYTNYPLLPRKDIRLYCNDEYLYELDTSSVAALKLDALHAFTSQTTVFYPDQCRPVLSEELLRQYSRTNEFFLIAPFSQPRVCILPGYIIRFLEYLQPRLKRYKETLRYHLRRQK